jgi:DNA-binding PadR family transcriptional regulator
MFNKLIESGHHGMRHSHRSAMCSEARMLRRGGRHHADPGNEPSGHHGRERGRRMHRLFEHGELRLVLLALVGRKPSHGYELIKAIEQASCGVYVPSPGVIYPTLTLLEEQDFLLANLGENGRKSYTLTDAGRDEIAKYQPTIDAIFIRLAQAENSSGNLADGIAESMHQLKSVLRANMLRSDASAQQISDVNRIIADAAKQIEALFLASMTEGKE